MVSIPDDKPTPRSVIERLQPFDNYVMVRFIPNVDQWPRDKEMYTPLGNFLPGEIKRLSDGPAVRNLYRSGHFEKADSTAKPNRDIIQAELAKAMTEEAEETEPPPQK